MSMNMFRDLKASEIDCRIAQVKSNGLSLLLYKDARVDQNILDETVGPYNWKREHEVVNGNLFCTVSLYDKEKGQWVSKQDVGVESYTEKEKGQASDAFKRACFNWGIGRELYTAPFIWIDEKNCNIDTAGGKAKCNNHFYVSRITIKDKVITELEVKIEDYRATKTSKKQSKVVFSTNKRDIPEKDVTAEEYQEQEPTLDDGVAIRTGAKRKTVASMCAKHGIDPIMMCAMNGMSWDRLTEDELQSMMNSLIARFGDK